MTETDSSTKGQKNKLSSLAQVSFVLGYLSWIPLIFMYRAEAWVFFILPVASVTLGILALRDIRRSQGKLRGTGIAVAGIVFPGVLLLFLFPPCTCPSHEAGGKAQCQTNMHEIAMAFQMYVEDYDGVLPTWATYKGKPGATPDSFRKLQGKMPAPPHKPQTTWPMRLSSHLKNKDIIWCPEDSEDTYKLDAEVSFILKKVLDSNYAGGSVRKPWREKDFSFPAEQVLFYERKSFHWGSAPLADAVSINVAFFDSHVKTIRLQDVGAKGEPDFFNWDWSADHKAGGPAPKGSDDPRKYCDRLN